MADLTLERFALTDTATFGRLVVGDVTLFTVERPWLDNAARVSCIPEGTYTCRPRRFFRGGYDAIEITDVPGRTHILFHVGNRSRDVVGCVAVGAALGCLGGEWAVLRSRPAFEELMRAFGGREFTLEVRSLFPVWRTAPRAGAGAAAACSTSTPTRP